MAWKEVQNADTLLGKTQQHEPGHLCAAHLAVSLFPLFFFFFFFFNVYLFLRERQSVSRGGAEREGDTEYKAGSRL